MDFIISKLYILPGIVIALSAHEFAHAKVAYMLGDPTASNEGRVTLNPAAHFDIIGFLMLMIAGFGWGKPVPVNGAYFKHRRRDEILVSAAGVTMNFILAIITALILMLIIKFAPVFAVNSVGQIIITMLQNCIFINAMLMVFNLIPIPPLDGFNIVAELTHFTSKPAYYDVYTKGPILLIFLVIFNLTDYILGPGIDAVYSFIIFLMGMIF